MSIFNIFVKLFTCVVCTDSSVCHKCVNNGFSVPCLCHGKAFAWAELREGFWMKEQVDSEGSEVMCYAAGAEDHVNLSIPDMVSTLNC